MITFHKTAMMLLLAGIVAAGFWGCDASHQHSSTKSHSEEKVLYQCSMHPQVVSEKPGSCPICGMTLTRVEKNREANSKSEEGVAAGHAVAYVSPARQQLIGLKIEEVHKMPLTVKIRTLGRVGYDPDLFDSILQYREALIAVRRQRGNPSTIVKQRQEEIMELAMQKLRLAGLSDMQIKSLTAYGQLSEWPELPVDARWVYADIYEYESNLVKSGQRVRLTAPSYPGKVFEGLVRTADEIYNASSFVQRIRIEMNEAAAIIKPGQSVDVEILAELEESVAVPTDALIDTGEQQLVFVDQGDGHLEPRSVRAGYEADGYYQILEGLKVGERVVASAAFLVDSESRLQAASQSFRQSSEPAQVNAGDKQSAASVPGHQHG